MITFRIQRFIQKYLKQLNELEILENNSVIRFSNSSYIKIYPE